MPTTGHSELLSHVRGPVNDISLSNDTSLLSRDRVGALLSRRVFLCSTALFPTAALAADLPETPVNRLAILASALTGGDPVAALDCFFPSSPDFATIENYLEALTAQTQISCAIETISESGGDSARALETDWLLQLIAHTSVTSSERRRQSVTIQMRLDRQKGRQKWRIHNLAPLSILSPINIR